MNCNDFSEKLDSYIHGELSEQEAAELDAHMRTCAACREQADFAYKIMNTLKNLPPIDTPADFKSKLYAKIDAEKTAVRRKKHFYTTWKPYAALAACVVLFVVLRTNVTDSLNSLRAPEPSPTPQAAQTALTPSVPPTAAPQDTPALDAQTDVPAQPEPVLSPTAKPAEATRAPARKARSSKTMQPFDAVTAPDMPVENAQSAAPSQAAGNAKTNDYTSASAQTEQTQNEYAAKAARKTALPTDSGDIMTDTASSMPETTAADAAPTSEAFSLRSAALDDQATNETIPSAKAASGGAMAVGGAASGAADTASSPSKELQFIKVSESDKQAALFLLYQYGTAGENGVFYVTRSEARTLLDALSTHGIDYEVSFDLQNCQDMIDIMLVEK